MFIGTIETLGLIAQGTNQSGGFRDMIARCDVERPGFDFVGPFVATWIVTFAIWRSGDMERERETQAAQLYANAGSGPHD